MADGSSIPAETLIWDAQGLMMLPSVRANEAPVARDHEGSYAGYLNHNHT